MKNLKKVIFALMVVFLVVGFIGCKTETDPKDPPASDPAGTGGSQTAGAGIAYRRAVAGGDRYTE